MVEFRGRRFDDKKLLKYLEAHRPRRLSFVETSLTDVGFGNLSGCKNTIGVEIYDSNVGDAAVHNICRLPRLEILCLQLCRNVTDRCAAEFASATQLQMLSLMGSAITDQALFVIGAHPKIWSLCVDDTLIDDDGVRALSPMTQLRCLSMCRCPVTGLGLVSLTPKDELTLYMDGTKVTDETLGAIVKSELRIKLLSLSDTSITNAGMKYLAAHPQLNMLRICNTSVTDEGLLYFTNHLRLEGIEISGTRITYEGISTIRRTNRRLSVR